MEARDFIRPKSESGEDNLVELISTYFVSIGKFEEAKTFMSNTEIKLVKELNYDIQKFAINKYFRSILVEEAGSRMKMVDGKFESDLDIRPALLNIQVKVTNLNWYNLIVSGVIKYILDNNIKLK